MLNRELASILSEMTGFRVDYYADTFIDFNVYIPYIEKRATLTVHTEKNQISASITYGYLDPSMRVYGLMNELTRSSFSKFYINSSGKLAGFAEYNGFDYSHTEIEFFARELKLLLGNIPDEELTSIYKNLVSMCN